MKATTFEFRNRFFIIGGIFGAGFFCYSIDHQNVVLRLLGDSAAHTVALRAVFVVAALVAVKAAMIRTWAEAYLRTDVVHDAKVRTAELVADGPYRYVRNPLYLGNVLLALALGAMASTIGAVVIVVGNVIFVLRLIGREEAELEQTQGESYRQYLRGVPKLVPALRARVPDSGRKPRWAEGLTGEAFFWAFACGVIVFAVTLNMHWFGIGMLVSFLLGVAITLAGRRKKAGTAATGK